MKNQMQFTDMARRESARIEKLLTRMEARYSELPTGSLNKKGEYYYRVYYEGKQKRDIIIPDWYDGRQELIDELCERRYISAAMPVLKKNLQCLKRLQRDFRIYDPQEIRARLPRAYNEYDLGGVCLQGDIDPQRWASENYECNEAYPERKIYKSEGGLRTRSKSEAVIATKLEQSGIAFRYEEVIYIGGRRLCPDFSVLHPRQRRVMYWEHFGMMEDPEYAAAAMNKICYYADNGIRAGDELIITWETRSRPLWFENISDCIDMYLR